MKDKNFSKNKSMDQELQRLVGHCTNFHPMPTENESFCGNKSVDAVAEANPQRVCVWGTMMESFAPHLEMVLELCLPLL